jgi:hypothetical protein
MRLHIIKEIRTMHKNGRLSWMGCFSALFLVGFATFAVSFPAVAQADQVDKPAPASSSTLPPLPKGKTTVIGGVLEGVDVVRDQFKLRVFGGKPVKVLFDARTKMFRDGKPISLDELHTNEHADVETVLDGTTIYAVSIHTLSQSLEGECQGQVLDFNPGSGVLMVSGTLAQQTISFQVPAGTPIVREGQAKFISANSGTADLMRGSLVSITFRAGVSGHDVATHIAVLATPGSTFIFTGNISVINLRDKYVVVADPTDDRSYQVFVSGNFPMTTLHESQHIRITANFDGTHYVATSIIAN